MNRCRKSPTALVAVLLLALGAGPALPEDEDTSASAYLVFDPETGEFVTVDDPGRSQHEAEIDDAIGSRAAERATGNGAAANLVPYVASGLAVLLGAAWWLRRRSSQR